MKGAVAILVLYMAQVSSVAAFVAFQTGVRLLQNPPPPHLTAAMMTPRQVATSTRRRLLLAISGLGGILFSGGGGGNDNAANASAMTFTLSSPAFANKASIPSVYTSCEGKDISSPLEWSGAPSNTKSLTLIIDDPDAPDPKAPKMVRLQLNSASKLRTTYSYTAQFYRPLLFVTDLGALGAVQHSSYYFPSRRLDFSLSTSSRNETGIDRYFFNLYALDDILPDMGVKATKADVEKAMDGHILGKADLVGQYKKAS